MDQIRRLPGSGSIRSGGDAYRPRLESTRSSSAGQIGVDGAAYGHKRSRSGLSAREESLPPPPSLFASFFPITFTRLLLLPFFFYRKTSPTLDAMRDTRHPEGGLAAVQAAAKKPEIS